MLVEGVDGSSHPSVGASPQVKRQMKRAEHSRVIIFHPHLPCEDERAGALLSPRSRNRVAIGTDLALVARICIRQDKAELHSRPGNVGTPISEGILVDAVKGSSHTGAGTLPQVKYQMKRTDRPLVIACERRRNCLCA